MKQRMWIIALGCLMATCLKAAQPLPNAPLHFAMEATYPPFTFIDGKNQIQGFEVDVANAVCQVLHRSCTFTHQAFDTLILNLKFHRFDAIISALDITAARAQQVAFTQPYYHNTAAFVVLRDQLTHIDQLATKRIGVQSGTTHQKYIVEQHKEMKVLAYDSYQNALIDLKSGRINALFADTAVVAEWLKQDQQISQLGAPVADAAYFSQGMAIAVRKDDTVLLEQLNSALTTLKQRGTLQALYNQWFN